MHQTTGELTVRAASRNDRLAICTLLQQAWHSAGVARWDQLDAIETGCEALLALRDGLAIGFSLLDLRALPVARLSAVAVADREDVSVIWGELWPAAEQYLSDQGVRQAYYVGEAPWLLDILAGQGFRRTGSVVSYEKVQDGPTLAGNPAVRVRVARSGETQVAAEIDAASFPPMWRYSQPMLHTATQTNARLTLAELDRRPVGYELCVHEGNTGQVVRLAVLPEYRRRSVGSRLLADALTTFMRRHVRRVAVNTQGDNLPAQKLYEKFGFCCTGDELPVLEKTLAH
jgi:ribosomal-protein-alanine N-acetyltransferase